MYFNHKGGLSLRLGKNGIRFELYKYYSLSSIAFLFKMVCFSHLVLLSSATYREHFVENEKICPDPLHSHSAPPSEEFPKDTLLVNLPKTLSLFESVNDFPCNFASSTRDNNLKKVIVRAIHPSTTVWDFGQPQKCDYFIKFKRSESHHNKVHPAHSHKNEVICRVWKQHDETLSREGSFYHPMIWNSPNNKMTLSFSTYDWQYRLEKNDTILYKPVYLQMVFLVYGDGDNYCSIRVQQYLINPMENPMESLNTSCKSSTIKPYQHCFKYECSEIKPLLQSIHFRTYEIDDIEISNRLRLHEKQQKELEKQQHNNREANGSGIEATEEADRSNDLSTIEQYDIFKTTTRTIINSSSNSILTNFHNFAVSSIMIVPIIVLVITILALRCYIKKCKSGYSSYDESENLIVPSEGRHQPLLMNTHVSMDGRVELDLDYDADAMPLYRSGQFSDSMDYITPFDVRNMNLSASKSHIISAPPSYENLGPPAYSSTDAVVI